MPISCSDTSTVIEPITGFDSTSTNSNTNNNNNTITNTDSTTDSSTISSATILYGQGSIYKQEDILNQTLVDMSNTTHTCICIPCAIDNIHLNTATASDSDTNTNTNDSMQQNIELLKSFGCENRMYSQSNWNKYQDNEVEVFDWEEHYGKGFTICHTNI